MLKRIYNKGISILDLILGKIHLFFEKKGILKRIDYSVYNKIENQMPVDHKYPANYDEKDKKLFDHCTKYQTQPETIFKFEKVNIAERGIIFKKFNNIGLSFPHVVFRAQFGWLYLLKQYFFKKRIVLRADTTYILLYDFWSSANYYHWLVDSMPRLFAVKELLRQKNYSLLLPAKCPDYIIRSLAYFEINEITFLKTNEYVYAEQVLLPYYLAGSGHIHPVKVFEVTSYFKDKIKPESGTERIYVSRSRQKARKIINESEVIEIVKENGFRIVYFEDYNFEEQVRLANSTAVMVSSHGANLTNSMFMPENSRVMELIRSDHPNFCYWALATVSKLNYYYQLCEVKGNDHLFVNTDLFRLNLKKILNA